MALKLGPMGKKIATGAAIAGGLTLGGIALSKRAEEKRVMAADDEMDKKYPFSQNCLEMQHILKTANLNLAQMEAEKSGNAGAKRVRARNAAALKRRIAEIEAYIPSLDCSKAIVAPDGLPTQATAPANSNMSKYLLYGLAGVILIVVFSNLMKKKD